MGIVWVPLTNEGVPCPWGSLESPLKLGIKLCLILLGKIPQKIKVNEGKTPWPHHPPAMNEVLYQVDLEPKMANLKKSLGDDK